MNFINQSSHCNPWEGQSAIAQTYDPTYPLFLETASSFAYLVLATSIYYIFGKKRLAYVNTPTDRLWGHSVRNLLGLLSCLVWSIAILEGIFRWKYSTILPSSLNIISPLISCFSSACILVFYELIDQRTVKVVYILLPISLRFAAVSGRIWGLSYFLFGCSLLESVYNTTSILISANLAICVILDVIALIYWLHGQCRVLQSVQNSPEAADEQGKCDVDKDTLDDNLLNEKVNYADKGSNILSAITFWWYGSVIALGRKRPIEFEDIASVSEEETSSYQFDRFCKYYDSEKSLWNSFLRCYWKKLLAGGILKLFGDLTNVVGPLAILPIVNYVKNLQDGIEDEEKYNVYFISWQTFLANGWVLAWLALIASVAQSVFSQNSSHLLTMEGIHARSALQILIYRKSLRVSMWNIEERDNLRANNQRGDAAMLVNLSSNDVDNILGFFTQCHYIWAIPVKMGVLILLLYYELGYSAVFATFIAIFCLFPLQLLLIKKIKATGESLATTGDNRLSRTHEIISSIKDIKVNGWESLMIKRVLDARKIELGFLLKDSMLRALMIFLTQSSGIVIILVAFGLYTTVGDDNLDSGKVFSALALFSQLTVPLLILPSIIAHTIKAMRSVSRIEKYMRKGESGGIQDSVKVDDISPLPQEHETKDGCSVVVRMNNATFYGENASKPLVKNISTDIAKGQLTVILGEVGSGKTSCLLSILGELRLKCGELQWKRDESIAYVCQNPWLLNCSVKDNILFGKPFQEKRYKKVLGACCLDPDIDILPYGDETIIGEEGIKLSGGQRQRVAIARSLYHNSSVVIMDSPFSALDVEVTNAVFEASIMKFLLKKKKTVILTTQKHNLVTSANKIIYMKNGTILCEGTHSQLMESHPGLFAGVSNYEGGISNIKTIAKERNVLHRIARIFALFRRRKGNKGDSEENVDLLSNISGSANRNTYIPDSFSCNYQQDMQTLTKPVWKYATAVFSKSLDEPRVKLTRRFGTSVYPSGIGVTPIGDDSSKRIAAFVHFFRKKPFNRKRFSDIQQNGSEKTSFKQSISIDDEEQSMHASDENLQVFASDLTKEERERGRIAKLNYLTYFKACSPWLIACYIALSIMNQGLAIGIDIWMGIWSKSSESFANTTSGGNLDKNTFDNENIFYLQTFFGLSVSSIVIVFFTICFAQLASYKGCKKLYTNMLESVVFATQKFLESTPQGTKINRFSVDAAIIDQDLGWALMHLTFFSLLCASSILVNIVISPVFFIIFSIIICCIYYAVQHVFRSSSRELRRLESLSRSPLFGLIAGSVGSPSTIRAFGISNIFSFCYSQRVDDYLSVTTLFNVGNRWLGINLDFMGAFIVFFATIASLLGSIINFGTEMTPAKVGMAIKYTLVIPVYLNWVVRFLSDTEMCLSSVERIRQYILLQPEEKDNSKLCEKYIPRHMSTISRGPSIRFNSVNLYYNKDDTPIIKDMCFSLHEGEKVGICGRTGSGKSTILMAILRFLEKQEGSILIGDRDIANIPLQHLRKMITTVLQDGKVFNASVRFNMDPCNAYVDKDIWLALRKVKLFEEGQKDILDSIIGTTLKLSPGQKQLLGLARVILQKKSLVLLDEATSSLDPSVESSIVQLLISELSGSTFICVSHSTRMLMQFDTVLVISDGKLAESGNPHILSKNSSSLFSKLIRQ